MRAYLATTKCMAYALNAICLILGIGATSFSVVGLQNARVNSDEYAYFTVGVILGALICATTFFGYYAAIWELVGVNIVYALLMLILMVVQYMKLSNFQPQSFYGVALQHAEQAWEQLDTRPQLMAALEENYQCCGLQQPSDYSKQNLQVPSSCFRHKNSAESSDLHVMGCFDALDFSYQVTLKREKIYSYSMMTAEALAIACAATLVVILYLQRRQQGLLRVRNFMDDRGDQRSSRSFLMSR